MLRQQAPDQQVGLLVELRSDVILADAALDVFVFDAAPRLQLYDLDEVIALAAHDGAADLAGPELEDPFAELGRNALVVPGQHSDNAALVPGLLVVGAQPDKLDEVDAALSLPQQPLGPLAGGCPEAPVAQDDL